MTGHRLKDKIPLVILLSAIILAAVIRLRLLNIPLERDEGEYAYMAQLLLHGFPPYVKAYTMKFPGIYPLYSFIMTIFGQTIAGIHLGLTIVNAATTVMIFLLAKKLFDPYTGAFAGASFAVLSLGKSVLGLAANAEHFVIFFVSAGMIVMLKALGSSGRGLLFLSGVLLGIGVAIKQHSIFFVIFAALYVVWHISTQDIPRSKCVSRAIAYLVSGAVLPMFLICFAFTATGSFEKFWFWTVIYSREYLKGTPFIAGVRFFIERLGAASLSGLTLWFAAAAGAGILCRRITGRGSNVFTLSFAFFSFLALMPGFLFREHYFILVLPALSILSGVAMRKLFDPSRFYPDPGGFRKSISAGLCLVLLCYPLMNERSVFFVSSPEDASRIIYGSNPFPEAVKIAEYLKKNIADDQSVAVFGSEPQIYFYLRKTARPVIYICTRLQRISLTV